MKDNTNILIRKYLKKKISKTEVVGRYKIHHGIEKKIYFNLLKNLNLKSGSSFLDIGCGCGYLSEYFIKYCISKKIFLYLMDINSVIRVLKKENKSHSSKYVNFINSKFESYYFKEKKFDRILSYSVIQYANSPEYFLRKAFNLLKAGGRLLIGDIPNTNKKSRFITSEFGKEFDIKFKKKIIKVNPNHIKEVAKTKQRNIINDKFIVKAIKIYRKKNSNSYLIEQPKSLPFSYTREDLLIEKLK